MQAEKTERVLVILPRPVADQFTALADQDGLSRSALIRQVLMRYLREGNGGQAGR